MRYRSLNQAIFAILLSGLGIILLLINIGVISLEIKQLFVVFYPFVLFVYGSSELITSLAKKRDFLWGLFMSIFSTLLVLDRLGLFSFRFLDVWKLWPILLIYFGLITMMFRKGKIRVHFKKDFPLDSMDEGTEELKNPVSMKRIRGFSAGDVDFKKQNWAVEPMDLYNMVGDYFIDFSKGFIPEKETPVKVRGWIGDVRMLIPEDVPVKVSAAVNVGEVRIFDYAQEQISHSVTYKSDNYDDVDRKLNITVDLKIGSIRIDRV